MMCSRSLNGSSALMGSGSFTFANEPLLVIPSGMHVLGIEALILHEEDDTLERLAATVGRRQ